MQETSEEMPILDWPPNWAFLNPLQTANRAPSGHRPCNASGLAGKLRHGDVPEREGRAPRHLPALSVAVPRGLSAQSDF